MTTAPCLLAIDVGTSRTRAGLIAADGTLLAQAARERAPGADLDPSLLWSEVVAAVRAVADDGRTIVGVGIDAQLGTVLVDRRGEPLGELSPWSDRRPAAAAALLAERAGEVVERISRRPVGAELPACKLMWAATERPELLERAHRALSIKDFLNLKLTGSAATDPVHASYSGLYDVAAGRWSDELLGAAGVAPGLMPEVLPVAATLGWVVTAAAAALGIPAGVPVAVGGPDGTIGTIGAGGVSVGRAVDVAGTTDVLLVSHDRPPAASATGVVVNAHPIPGLFLVGGPSGLTSGGVDRLTTLLGCGSGRAAWQELGAEIDRIPPGAEGLRVDPSLGGSRFPRWRESARGMIAGLSASHTRAHLYRAAQEGSAFVVAEGIAALRAAGIETEEVVVVGGLASNPVLLQLRCDAWDLPVLAAAEAEASTLGTAMAAAVAAGIHEDLVVAAATMVRHGSRYEPDPEAAAALAAVRADWTAMVRPETSGEPR